MKFQLITLITHGPDPATGVRPLTTGKQHRESLELFHSDVAPVLRRDIPGPEWQA